MEPAKNWLGGEIIKWRTLFLLALCVIGALAVLFAGHALNPVSAFWGSAVQSLAFLLFVPLMVTLIWDIHLRRALMHEFASQIGLNETIVGAGIAAVWPGPDVADWQAFLKSASRKLDVFFAYGRTWRGRHEVVLRELLERQKELRLRVFLPDPNELEVLGAMAQRFDKNPQELAGRIREAAGDFLELANSFAGRVSVSYFPGQPTFCIYRTDTRIMVSLYTHGRTKVDTPIVEVRAPGQLYDFFSSELDKISDLSRVK